MNSHSKKLVITALFAALTCVATMAIRIPTPGTGGYIHPGDAIVILSGIILGPGYGLLAAGIGSALADLLGGYLIYVPITFVIKGSVAFICGAIYHKLTDRQAQHLIQNHSSAPSENTRKRRHLALILCGLSDTVFIVCGYFLCEVPLYGVAAAAASAPANLLQGISGLILATILYPLIPRDFLSDISHPSADCNQSPPPERRCT